MSTNYAKYSGLGSGGGGGVVTIYPNVAAFPASTTTGDLAVDASTGNLYEFNGAAWVQIAGPGAAISLGNLDTLATSATKAANLVGGVLAMQSASATLPGIVNTTTQTLAGNKTFSGTISASNLSGTNTGDVTLGTASGLSLVGQALSLALSSTSTTGALSSTDWNTFNGKQDAGNYITALTGDATASGPGSAALTLATVNANVGSFGGATSAGTFTVNAKGLITAASNTSIQIAESQVTNLVSDLAGKQAGPLTGDVTTSGAAATLATVNSNVGSFTNASVTVNAKGLVTAASSGTAPVTSLSVASANGFAGSSSGGATPALTLSTTITGVLKGNGTAISAATSGTDYSAGTSGLSTGILKSTTTTGALTIAVAGDFPTLNQNTTGTASDITASSNTSLTSLANLATVGTVTSGTWSATTIALNKGGTGQTTKAAAFDALSPMSAGGDLIYGGASGTGTRLANGSAGQYLKSQGTTLAPIWATAPGASVINQQMFTSSGTFTIPAGAVSTTVFKFTVQGAGGGGGGGNASNSGGGGGGAGSAAIKYLSSLTAGNTITVTIGAAGTAGSAAALGGDGGDTTLTSGTQTITTVTGKGGKGGLGNSTTQLNVGGHGGTVATNGDINMTGQGGGFGAYTAAGNACGGQGGSSIFAGGGRGGSNGNSSEGDGDAGVLGGGGGGGGAASGVRNGTGGAGGAGAVLVEWVL